MDVADESILLREATIETSVRQLRLSTSIPPGCTNSMTAGRRRPQAFAVCGEQLPLGVLVADLGASDQLCRVHDPPCWRSKPDTRRCMGEISAISHRILKIAAPPRRPAREGIFTWPSSRCNTCGKIRLNLA
jgi:hypothetical protein